MYRTVWPASLSDFYFQLVGWLVGCTSWSWTPNLLRSSVLYTKRQLFCPLPAAAQLALTHRKSFQTASFQRSNNMSEDVFGGASCGSSGGVWEQSAGLRWQLVGEQEERIPNRSRSSSRRDGPVDPGLSIQVTRLVDQC